MKKRLIRLKIYMDRGRGYMGIVQFFAIMYVSLNVFLEKHNLKPGVVAIAGAVIGLTAFLIIVGRLEYKWGLWQEENKRHSEGNPVMIEILKKLDEIKEKL